MTTVLQIIEGATEAIGVKTAEIKLEAADFQLGITEMNDMLTEWSNVGLLPEYVEVTESDAVLLIPRNSVSAIKANLAIRLAPSFQKVVTSGLVSKADSSLRRLENSVVFIGDVAYPDSLPTGSGNDCSDIFLDDRFFPDNKPENF